MADAAKIIMTEGDAPATPAAGTVVMYPKTDKLYYQKDSDGNEYALGGTAGTSAYATTAGNAGTSYAATLAATTEIKGVVELATDAETVTGASTSVTTTPANITARLAAPGAIGGTTPAAGTFTTLTADNINQSALTNLLTNSQWMAMSGSTLCEVTSGAAPVTDGANAALVNNLLTNGGFDSATTGWSLEYSTALASVVGGKTGNCLEITLTAGSLSTAYQVASLTVGKIYTFSAYVKSGSAGDTAFKLQVHSTDIASILGTSSGSWVLSSITFEATATDQIIYLIKNNATVGTMLFDSATLYEVTPGYVAADAAGPDGWSKGNSIDIWRQHNDSVYTKKGSFYSVKLTHSATGDSIYWPTIGINTGITHLEKFRSRTVTFGAWVYATAANTANLTSYDGGSHASSFHSGSSTWEWIEFTYTVSSTAVQFDAQMQVINGTAYFSQPMLVFSSSIGEGNFAPIPNEQILCQDNVALTDYTATTSAADGIINLESQSSGKIGKGVKAVLVKAYGKDSAAGDGVGFDVQSASGVEDGISVDTQVNNIRVQGQGWVKCDANGDIYLDHRGSGAAALTLDVKVIGVQP
jgi:hypothetical protein